jgi:hypothetical protein
MDKQAPGNTASPAFLVIGLVFLALGCSGQTVFLGVGTVFMALGATLRAKAHTGDQP